MARPDRGKFATGPAGDARYKAALKKHLANKAKAAREAAAKKKTPKVTELAKKPVPKKPVAKKTVAKKTVAKKPVAKKPVAKKPVTKKPVTKKPVTKKTTPKSKTTPRTTGKSSKSLKIKDRYVRRGQFPKDKNYGNQVKRYQRTQVLPKDGRNYGNPEKGKSTTPETKPTKVENLKNAAKQGKEFAGKTVDKTKEGVKNLKNKADKFFDPAKPNKPATTGPQKFFSKAGKKLGKGLSTAKNYTKTQVLPKLGSDLLKIAKNNPASTLKSAGKAGIGALGQLATDQLTDRAFRALRGENKKSLKQFREERDKEMGKRGLMRLRPKNIGKTINSLRGKGDNTSTQSSTTTTNKSNNTNKNNKLKVKKDNNSLANQIKVAKKRVRNASGYNKEKLQREVDYLEKFGKQPRTWSNPYGAKGKGKPSTVKTDTTTSKSAKPGSARAKLREKNEARFGKPHVDKLRAKNRDFQAMKKKKLTKKEFIRRYPNSQTAKRARGM